jgi:hypothetical protein
LSGKKHNNKHHHREDETLESDAEREFTNNDESVDRADEEQGVGSQAEDESFDSHDQHAEEGHFAGDQRNHASKLTTAHDEPLGHEGKSVASAPDDRDQDSLLTGRAHTGEMTSTELSILALALTVPVVTCIALLVAIAVWLAVRAANRNSRPLHLGTPATSAQQNDSFYHDNQLFREKDSVDGAAIMNRV